jgi:hypothetical protein
MEQCFQAGPPAVAEPSLLIPNKEIRKEQNAFVEVSICRPSSHSPLIDKEQAELPELCQYGDSSVALVAACRSRWMLARSQRRQAYITALRWRGIFRARLTSVKTWLGVGRRS